jgi:hypothetical protein
MGSKVVFEFVSYEPQRNSGQNECQGDHDGIELNSG